MNLKEKLAVKAKPINEALEKYLRIREPKKLYKASAHIPLAGGKRLRPVMAMITCDMVGGTNNASGSRGFAASNMDLPTGGKWYCEMYMDSLGNDDIAMGVAADTVLGYYASGGTAKPGAYLLRSSGIVYWPYGQLGNSSDRSFTSHDLVGLALDLESSTKTIFLFFIAD